MLQDFVKPGIPLREAAPNVYSVFEPGDDGAAYDSKAAAYDRAVSSNLYLRLAWGVTRAAFAGFINDAFNSRDGLILDLAAGTSVDAVHSYVKTDRPVIVLDLSLAMLVKGVERLQTLTGQVPANVMFLQADAKDLPIADERVSTLLSHGGFHLFSSIDQIMREWRRVLMQDGGFFVTSIVRERWLGNQLLKALHAAGEVSAPRTALEVAGLLSKGMNTEVRHQVKGNFVFVRGAAARD